MNWLAHTLSSTIGRKVLVALTGIFLILFLVVHLLGNLQLLKADDGEAFNKYAQFMGHNPLIQAISILNFSFIALHIAVTVWLTARNKAARGPVQYAYNKPEDNSRWSSRNMGILGTIILVFLLVHLKNFWFKSKFGYIPMQTYGGEDYKDLYTITRAAFQEWWVVLFYVASMFGVAFHLSHGFQSAFQTFGLKHPKYTPAIKAAGLAFSILVPATYAAIPVLMLVYH